MTYWKIPPRTAKRRHRPRPQHRRMPYFVSDACLRCQRLFGYKERCLIVTPPEGLQIGLIICQTCTQGRRVDQLRTTTIYLPPPGPVLRTWPSLHGHRNQVQGYAKQCRLSNGVYTVGLCQGHVEVWSAEDLEQIPVPEGMAYSQDYQLYGQQSALPQVLCYAVVEYRFVDLSQPWGTSTRLWQGRSLN